MWVHKYARLPDGRTRMQAVWDIMDKLGRPVSTVEMAGIMGVSKKVMACRLIDLRAGGYVVSKPISIHGRVFGRFPPLNWEVVQGFRPVDGRSVTISTMRRGQQADAKENTALPVRQSRREGTPGEVPRILPLAQALQC